MKKTWIPILALLLLPGAGAFAQTEGDNAGDTEELNIIEVELERAEPRRAEKAREAEAAAETQRPVDFSDLGGLAPFAEVSVLQKRYMPKTGRFQAFGGLGLVTNDPFFNSVAAVGKLGYFLSETWGIELNYWALSTSEAQATRELRAISGVNTDSLVLTRNAAALDLVFVPIYGKMTWLNEKIIPFDLYFSLGPGTSTVQTVAGGQTVTQNAQTVHLATGQIFSLSKSMAFRWDFSWNFFQSQNDVTKKMDSYDNLFLTVGASFFFPEAKYR